MCVAVHIRQDLSITPPETKVMLRVGRGHGQQLFLYTLQDSTIPGIIFPIDSTAMPPCVM